MSTKPRTPRYFPKMKVRGAKRRQIAPYQRLAGSFDRMVVATSDIVKQLSICSENGLFNQRSTPSWPVSRSIDG